jgi:hypothetical protein
MKSVTINTQGIKGGLHKMQSVGYVALFSDSEKIISVDNFSGFGDTYRQMKEPIICIFGDGQNDCIFEGTHAQLVDLLNKHKEMLNQLKVK